MYPYINSLLKDLSECQNVSVTFPCIHLCLSSGDLLIFFSKNLFIYLFLLQMVEKFTYGTLEVGVVLAVSLMMAVFLAKA